jgi:hypothetical protein
MDKPAPQTDQTATHEIVLEYGRHLVISHNCDFTFNYTLGT